MTSTALYIDRCLAHLGTGVFASVFCDFVEALGIDQIMVFSVGQNGATCMLSRHFSDSKLADELATLYLSGGYLSDPLLQELLAATPDTVTLRRFEDVSKNMTPEYRQAFFDKPGLSAKTTLLAVGVDLRLFVSLYQSASLAPPPDPDLSVLIGRLMLLHFDRQLQSGTPVVLDVLSVQERTVCLGILAGQKAERIAADIGGCVSNVVEILWRRSPSGLICT